VPGKFDNFESKLSKDVVSSRTNKVEVESEIVQEKRGCGHPTKTKKLTTQEFVAAAARVVNMNEVEYTNHVYKMYQATEVQQVANKILWIPGIFSSFIGVN
jgi:hypothetical protein